MSAMKKTLVIILISAITIGCFCGIIYKCYHNENRLYYGNDNYCYVTVSIGSGKSHVMYHGAITVSDYNKWCNGDEGTLFVYSTISEGYGNRINIDKITRINNYGNKPEWLPMNFLWS